MAHRPRESPHPMISVEEAIKIVLDESDCLGTEEVSYKGDTLCL